MNTGRQALENVGIKVAKYYSSEIKPYAIELTQHHFPDTIQLGDIKKIDVSKLDHIDMILSGSPCKDLSAAGKRAGIYGKNSGLFWEFIRILKAVQKYNPNVLFFQENVGSANKKDIRIMSEALGVLPVRINSKLVTAQLRDRYYWTNIKTREDWTGYIYTDIPQPKDKGVLLRDIITSGEVDREKSRAILESEERIITDMNKLYRRYKQKGFGNIVYENTVNQINPSKESGGKQPYQQNRIYDNKGKAPCLTESGKARFSVVIDEKTELILNKYKGLIEPHEKGVKVKTNRGKGFKIAKDGDSLNLSFPTSKTRGSRVYEGKSPTLVKTDEKIFTIKKDGKNLIIRPLNKIELCRLQGFPDNYCDILTRNKAASLLGDGWTLPIIEHIFNHIDRKTFLPIKV